MRIIVTGGCGFIGANFLNLFVPTHPQHQFLNLDALTYAGNPLSLTSIENQPNYQFQKRDLADQETTLQAVQQFRPDLIVHFAAESHVDRSIKGPRAFLDSNVVATFNLLEAARQTWGDDLENKRFYHVSTDEVYGELGPTGLFTEETPYAPSSPYSASKAASDHYVRAWHRTYGLPVTITNCSNNYGPYQFPEKLIPVMVLNAAQGKPLPLYGKGQNIRDWLFVEDHCHAIWTVIEKGKIGETYNVGGNAERTNLQVVEQILQAVAEFTHQDLAKLQDLLTYVPDRPGHDFRYAIDTTKISTELGWQPQISFEDGIKQTVAWYLENPGWIESVKSGEYLNWIKDHYGATV